MHIFSTVSTFLNLSKYLLECNFIFIWKTIVFWLTCYHHGLAKFVISTICNYQSLVFSIFCCSFALHSQSLNKIFFRDCSWLCQKTSESIDTSQLNVSSGKTLLTKFVAIHHSYFVLFVCFKILADSSFVGVANFRGQKVVWWWNLEHFSFLWVDAIGVWRSEEYQVVSKIGIIVLSWHKQLLIRVLLFVLYPSFRFSFMVAAGMAFQMIITFCNKRFKLCGLSYFLFFLNFNNS